MPDTITIRDMPRAEVKAAFATLARRLGMLRHARYMASVELKLCGFQSPEQISDAIQHTVRALARFDKALKR